MNRTIVVQRTMLRFRAIAFSMYIAGEVTGCNLIQVRESVKIDYRRCEGDAVRCCGEWLTLPAMTAD